MNTEKKTIQFILLLLMIRAVELRSMNDETMDNRMYQETCNFDEMHFINTELDDRCIVNYFVVQMYLCHHPSDTHCHVYHCVQLLHGERRSDARDRAP